MGKGKVTARVKTKLKAVKKAAEGSSGGVAKMSETGGKEKEESKAVPQISAARKTGNEASFAVETAKKTTEVKSRPAARESTGNQPSGYRQKIVDALSGEEGQKRVREAIAAGKEEPQKSGGYRAVSSEYLADPETKLRAVGALRKKEGVPTYSFFGAPLENRSAAEVLEMVERGEMYETKDGGFRYTLHGEAVRRDAAAGEAPADNGERTVRFIWPVEGGKVTSPFGSRERFRTKNGAWSSAYHPSIDIGAPEGTPILSVADGKVIFAGVRTGYGNTVEIKHDDGSMAKYHHMVRPTSLSVGSRVSQGDRVGAVGETGNSTGPHLDITLIVDGKTVDPEQYLDKTATKKAPSGQWEAIAQAAYDAYRARETAAGREPVSLPGMDKEPISPSRALLAKAEAEGGGDKKETAPENTETAAKKEPAKKAAETGGAKNRQGATGRVGSGEDNSAASRVARLEDPAGKSAWDGQVAEYLQSIFHAPSEKIAKADDFRKYLLSLSERGGMLAVAGNLLADRMTAHPEQYGEQAIKEALSAADEFREVYRKIREYVKNTLSG